ncbi:MAG: hypothetical protein U0R44_01240 [Candidatus Micrarchaeia archaeon]
MTYTIRNVTEATKERLNRFADEHNLTIAEALHQLVESGAEYHEQTRKNPKRYKNAQEAMKDLPEWME